MITYALKNMALEEREYLKDLGFKYLVNYIKLSVKTS